MRWSEMLAVFGTGGSLHALVLLSSLAASETLSHSPTYKCQFRSHSFDVLICAWEKGTAAPPAGLDLLSYLVSYCKNTPVLSLLCHY